MRTNLQRTLIFGAGFSIGWALGSKDYDYGLLAASLLCLLFGFWLPPEVKL